MKTELSFQLKEGNPYGNGTFVFEDLQVNPENKEPITYKSLKLYLNGEAYQNTIENWAGVKADANDLLETVLNAYFRKDLSSFEPMRPEWKEHFSCLEETYTKRMEDNTLLEFPQISYGEITAWQMDFILPDCYYASEKDGDRVLLLDDKRGIISDVEALITGQLYQDAGAVLCGDKECIYQSDNIKYFIEAEGKDDLIEAYKESKEEQER